MNPIDPLHEVPILVIASAITSALFNIDVYTTLAVFVSALFAVTISPKSTIPMAFMHCFFGVYFSSIIVGAIHSSYPTLSQLVIAVSVSFVITYFWRLILDAISTIFNQILTTTISYVSKKLDKWK
jgi:hypothetical protein